MQGSQADGSLLAQDPGATATEPVTLESMPQPREACDEALVL